MHLCEVETRPCDCGYCLRDPREPWHEQDPAVDSTRALPGILGPPGAGRNSAEKLKGPALGQSRSQRWAEGSHGADMTAHLSSSGSSCELTCR